VPAETGSWAISLQAASVKTIIPRHAALQHERPTVSAEQGWQVMCIPRTAIPAQQSTNGLPEFMGISLK
jgi:hypothetical protein